MALRRKSGERHDLLAAEHDDAGFGDAGEIGQDGLGLAHGPDAEHAADDIAEIVEDRLDHGDCEDRRSRPA